MSASGRARYSPGEAPRLDRGEESRCQLVGGLATHPGKPRSLTAGRSQLSNDIAGEVTIPGGELRGIRGGVMNLLWLADQVRAPRRPAAGLLGGSDEPVVAS